MRHLMITAATLALLAAPAFAQDEQHGKAAIAHMNDQPAAPGGGDHRGGPGGGEHRGGGAPGGNRGGAAQPAAAPAPAAQPQAARPDHRGDAGGNRGNVQRPDAQRPDNGNRGPGNGFGNRPDTRPGNGFGNNNSRPGPGFGGPRHDFSSFRNYHQSFRAQRRFRGPDYRRPPGWYQRRWTFGEILPGLFWSQQYWLTDYNSYDLPPPPYGAVWVRDGNDALLVDRDSGEIITVEYDMFY